MRICPILDFVGSSCWYRWSQKLKVSEGQGSEGSKATQIREVWGASATFLSVTFHRLALSRLSHGKCDFPKALPKFAHKRWDLAAGAEIAAQNRSVRVTLHCALYAAFLPSPLHHPSHRHIQHRILDHSGLVHSVRQREVKGSFEGSR